MTSREDLESLEGEGIGDYVIEKFLGAGGQAVVYKARSQALGTLHALKIFGLLDSTPGLDAGLAEAKKQSQVEHSAVVKVSNPNIEQLQFLGEPIRVLYLPMTYAPLGSCEDLSPFANRPLVKMDFRVMKNLMDGLKAIHGAGLTHNDIKPANILRYHDTQEGDERDNLLITDFGIAKVLEAIGGAPGDVSGLTTMFMSPEQLDHRYSREGDIYSMGATLYHMLTGEHPIKLPPDVAPTLLAWQTAHKTAPRPDVRDRNPYCPPRLSLLIIRMMSVERDQRPGLNECIAELNTIIALMEGQVLEFGVPPSLEQAIEATSFPLICQPKFRGIFKPEVHTACGSTLFVLRWKMRYPLLHQYRWMIRSVARQFADTFSMYETWGSYDINMFLWTERNEIDKLTRHLKEQFPGSEAQVAAVSKVYHFHTKNETVPKRPSKVMALAVQEGVDLPGLDPSAYLVGEYPADIPERSVHAFTYVEAVEDIHWTSFLRNAIAEQVRSKLHEMWHERRDEFRRMSILELEPDNNSRLAQTAALVDYVATEYRYLPDVPTTIIEKLGESAVRTLTCLETRRIMIQSDKLLL